MNALVALLVVVVVHVRSGEARFFHTPLSKTMEFACTAENLKASRTYFCDTKGTMHCLPGWSDPSMMCMNPICSINGRTCVNGNCTRPFTCDCEVGWMGQFCETCVPLPGCVNGGCTDSFECNCQDGWVGMYCDRPWCSGCKHGQCLMPGVCSCLPGWTGVNCDQCESREDCKYGSCEDQPFQCKCYAKYSGISCEKPICNEGCHPEHGYCNRPEQCLCRPGWTGDNCDICVKDPKCLNGRCINKPWECVCSAGYKGTYCDTTEDIDGSWGSWGPWSQCSVTCGTGSQTRHRHCDSPAPKGDGRYCSENGSDCVQESPCEAEPCGPDGGGNDGPIGFWSQWGPWTSCTETCGGGFRHRTRECASTLPAYPGAPSPCEGDDIEAEQCNSDPCPSYAPIPIATLSPWEEWSECSQSCGGGIRQRNRFCISQLPSIPGDLASPLCAGDTVESEICNAQPCLRRIDGGYSEWTQFSPCTANCVDQVGERVRRRFCTNPEPANGGEDCIRLGPNRERIDCLGVIENQSRDPSKVCYSIGE